MNISQAIEILRQHYGNHSAAAKALGYSVGHYTFSRHQRMSGKIRRVIIDHASMLELMAMINKTS